LSRFRLLISAAFLSLPKFLGTTSVLNFEYSIAKFQDRGI